MPSATFPAAQPPSNAGSEDCCLALSPPIRVKVGAKDGFAIGYKFKSEGGKIAEEYLVARPGTHYLWENGDQVTMPTSPNGAGGDAQPGAEDTAVATD
jgi:hypothetical protein